MDDLNKLVEDTIKNSKRPGKMDRLSPEGKEYLKALVSHCIDNNKNVPYAAAHRMLREKFGLDCVVDTARAYIQELEAEIQNE